MSEHDQLEREADKATQGVKSGGMPSLSAAVELVKDTVATVDAVVGFSRVIVADDSAVAVGQMRRTEFLRRLDATVRLVADPLLAKAGRSTADCPFIMAWLDHYRDVAPDKLERAARIYTLSRPDTAEDLLREIGLRVRRSVETWLESGQITGIPELGDADLASDSATIARKAEGGGSAHASPRAVRGQLGPGRPLGGATAARMGRAFGTSFDHVRVHTDANAAALAGKLSARAFTVGSDVAFAPGQFQPGTAHGDGLIAHELAHVVQQRGGSAATTSSAEHDANDALHAAAHRDVDPNAPVPQPKPTGLALQRCGATAPDSPVIDRKEIEEERKTKASAVHDTTKQLHDALVKRDTIAANTKLNGLDLQHQLDDADAEIARLRKQLRDEGVQVGDTGDPKTDLHSRVLADANVDLTQYNARLELSSNLAKDKKVPFGDETAMRVRLDYVPPDTPVEVEWRYKSPKFTQEYMFPMWGMPARYRSNVLDAQLDASFWSDFNVARVLRAGGDGKLEVVAHVYLGGDTTAIANLKDTIQFTDEVPDENITLSVTGGALDSGPNRVIAAPGAKLRFTPSWVPPVSRFVVHWKLADLENHTPPSELLPVPGPGEIDKELTFPKTGTYAVIMDAVGDLAGDDPWVTHPDPDTSRNRTAAVRVEIMDADKFGNVVLDRLEATAKVSPRQQLPDYLSGLQEKENEARRIASRAGDTRDLYESRADSLWKTKHDIERRIPDAGKSSPMPATDDEMAAGVLYASPVTSALVLPENKGAQPLSTYLTIRKTAKPDGTTSFEAIVLDGTSSDAWTFTGSASDARGAAIAAFADMKAKNPYPIAGKIHYRFKRAGWDPIEGSFSTTTNAKLAEHYVEKILEVAGYVAAALLMMFPEAVITKWIAMGLLVASVGLSTYHIIHNIQLGIPWYDSRNVIEGLSIIASILGLSGSVLSGRAFKAFRLGVGRPLMFRSGNALILAAAATDVGTFVYTSTQALDQIRAALADPTLKDDEKLSMFLRVSMQLMVGGLMLFESNKELFTNLRKSNFLKTGFDESKIQFDIGTQMDLMAELRRTGWTPDQIKTMAPATLYQRYLAAGQLRSEVDPKRIAIAAGEIRDPALREQLLTDPETWRALHNLDYNAAALEAHWNNYRKDRPPSKALKSTTFGEYLGTRGVSTELDTGGAPAPSPKLTEAFPNWGSLSTGAKQRTLLQTYEPTLVAALDPASTALPPHVKAALEAALNKDALGGATTVRGAREKLSSAVNDALAKAAKTPADLEAVTKLVGGSGSRGSIGETFLDTHLVDKAHAAKDKSQLVITKDEVPELDVKESFRPDRVITEAHCTLDVKTGYANKDLELTQAKNYRTLREKSQTDPALAAKLGGPLEEHAWLFLPGGEKPAQTVASDKRAWLNKNGFESDRVFFLGTDGQFYEVQPQGAPIARGTNIHAALGLK